MTMLAIQLNIIVASPVSAICMPNPISHHMAIRIPINIAIYPAMIVNPISAICLYSPKSVFCKGCCRLYIFLYMPFCLKSTWYVVVYIFLKQPFFVKNLFLGLNVVPCGIYYTPTPLPVNNDFENVMLYMLFAQLDLTIRKTSV